MCEFCTRHGEGKKWYLNAGNYSAELLNELDRRKFISHFYENVIQKGNRQISLLEKFLKGRFYLPQKVRSAITRKNQKWHFGQIIPLEEIPKILEFTTSITRIACGCRWEKEKSESRTCYGVSLGPPEWHELLDYEYFGSPDISRLEALTREEAYQSMEEDEGKGMVHSLWTFGTPFIGAICNCDSRYCLAMRSTVGLRMPVMFRAEYVAVLNETRCKGCKACIDKCQFGAIQFRGKKQPCYLDASRCYGCGVCRASCPEDAIQLVDRNSHPAASQLWM